MISGADYPLLVNLCLLLGFLSGYVLGGLHDNTHDRRRR